MINPLYFGKTVISLKIVDSTNNYSTELLKQGFVAEGTVIMAEEQTSGKGQRGNTWISEAGANLTCSIITNPAFLNLSDHFMLTRAVALAVADALHYVTDQDFLIKWPNDIFYGSKKIAGILIETVSSNNRINAAVIGVGINVNQVGGLDGFGAVSLKQISGKEHDLKEILNSLCFFLEKRYLKLKNGNAADIMTDYQMHLLGANQWMRFTSGENEFTGMIKDVSKEGMLNVALENGEVRQYGLKEIRFLIS